MISKNYLKAVGQVDLKVPYIHKIDDYHISIEKCFERIYGKVTDYVIIGVTPNYTTKKTSSLIYMINHLIEKSNKKQSQFIMDLKIPSVTRA